MSDSVTEEDLEKARLNHETALMSWSELQRYFASGSVLSVSSELDVVEVAYRMSIDDKAQVEGWLKNQKIGQVSDDQAKHWFEAEKELWTLVVRPWVLVQNRQ